MASSSSQTKARFTEGLNDFEYCASLCVRHPHLDPDLITQSLRLQPKKIHRVGAQRTNPRGDLLPGTYDATYWTAPLQVRGGEDIPTFLSKLSESLETSREFLQSIVKDGGRAECFMGVFAFGCCDQLFPCEQMATLGRLGIDLRLDYYGGLNSSNSTTEST